MIYKFLAVLLGSLIGAAITFVIFWVWIMKRIPRN